MLSSVDIPAPRAPRAPADLEETTMRYPAAETAEKHARILEQAARLFRERGFTGVSVGEIMKETGLTHGPFYNHFASKEALMAASFEHAAAASQALMDEKSPDAAGKAAYVAAYLDPAHRDAPGSGCPIAALTTDVAREPGVRGAYTAHVRRSIARFAERFPWSSKRTARREAIAALSAMVGALALARAVDDPALSGEILRETLASLR
jgi:TetR/AcrR family transcriptional repressor of nem operon